MNFLRHQLSERFQHPAVSCFFNRLKATMSQFITTQKYAHYWTPKRQLTFLKQYHDLVSAGYSVSTSLMILKTKFNHHALAPIMTACENGLAFSSGLEQLKFDNRAVYFIKIHENKHVPLLGIEKAHHFLKTQATLKQELSQQLRYPLQLFSLTFVAIIALFTLFLPKLSQFYSSLNIEQNTSYVTLIVTTVGILIVTSLIIGLLLGLTYYSNNRRLLQSLLKVYLAVPLLKQTAQTLFSYYYATQWLQFISCGSSFKETLESMHHFETIPFLKYTISPLLHKLSTGDTLEDVITTCPLFTSYFKLIVIHGLNLGCFESTLAAFQTEQLTFIKKRITQTFKIIQFIFLLCIGFMIVFIYLSLLQPVFDMMQLLS